MKYILSFFTFFSLFFTSLSHAALLNIVPESVEAAAWTVVDPQSGQIISEYNSHAQRAPASLTKMMVAYITLKEIRAGHLKTSQIITATPIVKVVKFDESQMYLKPGDKISIDQLLTGLVVMSANDAAVTLAERISGNLPAFVARMNKEAQALGMKNTHFANPAGISMPDHYSTAHDLSLLAKALVTETPQYLSYSKQKSFTYNQHYHHATNLVLKQDPTVDGLKTGYTKDAMFNLALTANRPTGNADAPNRRLIVVVLGTPSAVKRAEIAHKLMNLSYAYTRNEVILKPQQLIAELPVVKSTLQMFKIAPEHAQIATTSLYNQPVAIDFSTFNNKTQRIMMNLGTGLQQVDPLQNTQTSVDIKLNQKQLIAPLMQAVQLATVQVYQNHQLIHTFHIQNHVHIEEANILQRAMLWLSQLFNMNSAPLAAKVYPLQRT